MGSVGIESNAVTERPYSLLSVPGLYEIPGYLLDLRPDSEVDDAINDVKPVSDAKNIWFYWHSGYDEMQAYLKRNVRTWHRRFSKLGWKVRVVNSITRSSSYIGRYVDVNDPQNFPQAFRENLLKGKFALQRMSDLVRFPLLLRHGGAYVDVGIIPIGDWNRVWTEIIQNPNSTYDLISYSAGGSMAHRLTGYFLATAPNNRFFQLCQDLMLKLWAANGGRTSSEGMHASPLLRGIPLMGESENLCESIRRIETDYDILGQVLTMVMSLVDKSNKWNGPAYATTHIWAPQYWEGSFLYNKITERNGPKAFGLMSSPLPENGSEESPTQKEARELIEGTFQKSFGVKLAHGLIVNLLGDSLGALWRKNEGSDDMPGTYAGLLRYGSVHWNQDYLLTPAKFPLIKPAKIGPLLEPC